MVKGIAKKLMPISSALPNIVARYPSFCHIQIAAREPRAENPRFIIVTRRSSPLDAPIFAAYIGMKPNTPAKAAKFSMIPMMDTIRSSGRVATDNVLRRVSSLSFARDILWSITNLPAQKRRVSPPGKTAG